MQLKEPIDTVMYKEIDKLISSSRYKSLKLCRVDNKIYTEKYKYKYDGCADVLITDETTNLVCEYDKDNNYFIFGLINYCVTSNDYYDWDEELESSEETLVNDFLPKEDILLFLEFEFDLLSILTNTLPMIPEAVEVVDSNFKCDDFAEDKHSIYIDDKELIRYYKHEYNNKYYISMLGGNSIQWGAFIDYSDEDYDDYCGADIRNYEEFELYKAKDILYTIIKIIKDLK